MENGRMKTVLITGASRGIGRATALKFAQGGYGVGINYNNSKKDAVGLKKEIECFGGKAEILKADISDSGQTAKMIREAGEKLGSLDVLVNNAGIALPQGLFTDYKGEYRNISHLTGAAPRISREHHKSQRI